MITFTQEQQKIADEIKEQIYSPNGHNMIISAAGGTGKTSLICELVCDLVEDGKRVYVTAMTGKATAVLREKIENSLYERGRDIPDENLLMIETVATMTKKAIVVGIGLDGYTLFQNMWKDPATFPYDVIFIDELSMVPQWVVEWWIQTPSKVFGFGDFCQLPEIGGEDSESNYRSFKKHFNKGDKHKWLNGYGIKLLAKSNNTLTKVLRSDNEVALMCGDLRKTWMSKKEYIDVLKSWADKADCIEYSEDLADLHLTNDWQIICFTNKMCGQINEHLAINKDYPSLDDKIIIGDNINPIRIYNGNTMTFKEFRDAIKMYNQQRLAESKQPIAVCMKWKGEMPNIRSKNPIEREYAQTYAYYKNQFALVQRNRLTNLPKVMEKVFKDPTITLSDNQVQRLIERIRRLIKTSAQTPEKTFSYAIDIIASFDNVAASKVMEQSAPLPKLYMVTCDYGYAITCHKSQGSQYPKVSYIMEKFDRPLLYTGLSRAEKEIQIINLTQKNF